jgi:hypothetical protein
LIRLEYLFEAAPTCAALIVDVGISSPRLLLNSDKLSMERCLENWLAFTKEIYESVLSFTAMTMIRPSLGSLPGLATVFRSITSLLLVEPVVDLGSRALEFHSASRIWTEFGPLACLGR